MPGGQDKEKGVGSSNISRVGCAFNPSGIWFFVNNRLPLLAFFVDAIIKYCIIERVSYHASCFSAALSKFCQGITFFLAKHFGSAIIKNGWLL
jgi:hypothetical protein